MTVKSGAKKLMKRFFYVIEAILFFGLSIVLSCLPMKWGSAFGGWFMRTLAPVLSSKDYIVRQNLYLAGFNLSATEEKKLIDGMWDNIGRTFCEYFRLPYQDPFDPNGPYEIEGIEHLDALIHDKKPGLLFSAHFGNWELGTFAAQKRGLVTAQITRFLNNPLMALLVNFFHGRVARKIIHKGDQGAREIIRELKQGHHVSMLGDQKNDQGEAIPFFKEPAMTAKAFARLALKYDCPILPFHSVRKNGIECKIIYHPPLTVPKDGTDAEKMTDLMRQMNAHIENWIQENPEQWFWVHRRWDKKFYQKGNVVKSI